MTKGEDLANDVTVKASGRVDVAVREAETKVDDAISKAQGATQAATEATAVALAQVNVIAEHLKKREDILLEIEKETQKQTAIVRAKSREVEEDFILINNSLTEARTRIEGLTRAYQDEVAAQAGALNRRQADWEKARDQANSDFAARFESLALLVESIRNQVEDLQRTVTDEPVEPVVSQREIDEIVAYAQEQQIVIVPDPESDGNPLVYVQFAGVARERIQQISEELRRFSYELPGEERLSTAAGKHEVRYFWDDDREAARALASRTNDVLADLGYRANVIAEDLTGFGGKKPQKNTLELWLEPIPLRAKK
ncbi:hypothetical protein LCL97_08535 [Seohaeicola saemankumensis]|nr:hypothetical protein [Seohaeicola saemankumensis]MCA0870868.1 hypothetical protein [Seohaeicola saemankumensis]